MSEHCSGESGTRLSGGVFPSRIKPIFTIAEILCKGSHFEGIIYPLWLL